MRKLFFLALLVCACNQQAFSQTQQQKTGWFLFLNSTKFNEKWGLHLDVQVRSADNWEGVRNTLFRPGLTYYINKNNNVTLGYLLNTTFNSTSQTTLNEHRIWQQYIHAHQFKSAFVSHRFRLEQRFVERSDSEDIFAQRFRYFVRVIQPFKKYEQTFTKGAFVALQNEAFLNVQNKNQLNNSFFDQNRAYVALGYRFSKQFDLEAGYLNQAIKGKQINSVNHALQLAFYTRF